MEHHIYPLVKSLPYGCSHATGHPGEGADLITCGGGDGGLTVGTLHLDPELPEHHVVDEARLGDHNRRTPSCKSVTRRVILFILISHKEGGYLANGMISEWGPL